MILTRIKLNIRRAGARKILGSPQNMHAAIEAGFPTSFSKDRCLWRVDSEDPVRPLLYVLSPSKPDFTHIEEQAGWPTQPTAQSLSYEPILDALNRGQHWAFRLTANPTHRVKVGERTKIFAHKTVENQLAWLLGKQQSLGISLEVDGQITCRLSKRQTFRFKRKDDLVTLGIATFDGLLTVEDPGLLRQALTEGIGRAKAYGCGLMTLAKP